MSRPEISKAALGVLTTILTLVLVATWATKVSQADFEMHVQEEAATNEAILDILCADKPTHRRCR